ncbi:unnamed protein product [Ceratitis capitata]|uniref:(Mediterranean fruit fly) hypothetical protein n=1 Tax=Ceratitis capitata TaxID=7213 RepID=A0A811VCC1_CERCA|nr:unnamed protein product [Ceratitis capitata]
MWSTMNPSSLVQTMKQQMSDQKIPFDFDMVEQYMKRAGITAGYTEKPCLDPKSAECPDSAPNKDSQQPPDVGAILTGGCYGYATKYMHWPEELIVGGVQRNRSSHLRKAKGLQTVVQLMTEKEMFDLWNENYKVHHIGWTQEKAAEVLNAWQRNFSKEVETLLKSNRRISNKYDIYVFSSATLDDILAKYSNPSPISIVIGVIATVFYAFCTLIRWKDPVKGQSSVGVAGVLLIGFSTAAGLGLCALLGIVFNAASTQVVPFLALGFGVDHIFMLTAAYAESNRKEQTNSAARFSCHDFIGFASTYCRRRADIFCCCFPVWKEKPVALAENNARYHNNRRNAYAVKNCNNRSNSVSAQQPQLKYQEEALLSCSEKRMPSFSLSNFAVKYYTPFLMKSWVKFVTIITFIGTLVFSLYATTRLQDGLDLIDLVPKDTNEFKFLNAQASMFGFYSMYAVTQGNFEYPTNQRLLHEYHEAFVRVPHVIKNDNGGLPDFWLSLFRWLPNATSDAILAYKLLVQTGYVDNPVDKSGVTQNRLVDSEGIINPKAFYNYLSAWATNDVFAYGASQGKLHPEPRQYYHIAESAIGVCPTTFYLHGLNCTSEIKVLIGHIRDLSVKFEARGLPNYPSGIPFIFWEQYMTLRYSLALILCISLIAAFILVSILLLSVWAAGLVVFSVIASLIQIFGAMTLLGIKLSAIPAVILILSVGMIVCLTVHISLGFITSVGNRERRIHLSMQMSLGPLTHGVLTSALAVFMLSTSPFEFVIRHFFWLLLVVLCVGACNGLVLFPIILSMCGPEAELVPLEHPDRISTPSPVMSRGKRANKRKSMHHHKDININDPSLTTITEEPPSWKSSSSSIQMNNEWNGTNMNYTANGVPQQLNNYNMNNYYMQRQQQQIMHIIPCIISHQCISNHQRHKLFTAHRRHFTNKQYTSTPPPPPSTQQQQQPQPQHQQQPAQQDASQQQQQQQGSSTQSTSAHSTHTLGGQQRDTGNFPELQSIVVQPEVTVETHHSDTNTTKVTATANIKVELVTPGRAVRSYNFSS